MSQESNSDPPRSEERENYSRRSFIKWAGAAGLVGLAGAAYFLLGGPLPWARQSSSSTKTVTAQHGYPSGKRFVIITTIADFADGQPSWSLTSHTPSQVLSMLGELRPDTLHRYIQSVSAAAIDTSAMVPGSNPPMTVAQFVQESINASNSVVIPKVSLSSYNSSPDTFFSQARAFIDMQVNPPISYLSVDEWDVFQSAHGASSIPLIEDVIDTLRGQGWKGIEIGACGVPGIPDGYTDFSLFCVDPSTWEPEYATLSQLKGRPSNRSFQLSIDYPGPLQALQALPGDTQAQLLTKFASSQNQYGYSLVYPILLQGSGPAQLDYDSKAIATSSGTTLYDVMKGLMELYN